MSDEDDVVNTVFLLLVCAQSVAGGLYDPKQTYTAGQRVTFQGCLYEAQWLVNQDESPAGVTLNNWESPWVHVSGKKHHQVAQVVEKKIVTPNSDYFEMINRMHDKLLAKVNEFRDPEHELVR